MNRLQNLAHRNLARNRLNTLPPGFASLPALEALDLTYTNSKETSLPGNLFCLTTPRAL